MMQHALGTLADAWQQDHHQQVNNLVSHAAAEQLLGNRSELTINRVIPSSAQVDQQQPSCQLSDTTLYLSDGSRVRTHFLVLAAGSSFLRNQGFSSDIIVAGGEREDVLSVLQFLYTGVVNIQMNKLGDILDLARALSIDSLIATIEDIIDDVEKYSESSESTESAASYPPQHQQQSQTYLGSYEHHLQQQTTSSAPQNIDHQAPTTTQSLLSSALQQQSTAAPSGAVTGIAKSVFRGPLNLSHQPVIRSVASISNNSHKQQQQPNITNANPSPPTVKESISSLLYNAMTNTSQKTSPDILKRLNQLEPCDLSANASTQQQQTASTLTTPKIIVPNHFYKPELSPRSQFIAKSSHPKLLTARDSESNILGYAKSPSPQSTLGLEKISVGQRRPASVEQIDDDDNGAPRPKQIRISQNLLESVLLRNVPAQNNVNIGHHQGQDMNSVEAIADIGKQDIQTRLTSESKERQLFGAQILPLLGAAGGGNSNLSSLLSAAVKLKQVADIVLQKGEKEDRKLAFHEPRPCPTCGRMYRDAATLRTHTSIMHTKGPQPYRCSCGTDFETKYGMYQHKKSGHPAITDIKTDNQPQVDPVDPADPGHNHQQQDLDLEECDLVIATSPPPSGVEDAGVSGGNQFPVPMVKTS